MGNSEAVFESFESPYHYFTHRLRSALCCHSFCSSNMTTVLFRGWLCFTFLSNVLTSGGTHVAVVLHAIMHV